VVAVSESPVKKHEGWAESASHPWHVGIVADGLLAGVRGSADEFTEDDDLDIEEV
jgi:hypothetical protein